MNDNKVPEQPTTVSSQHSLTQTDKDKLCAAMQRALAILRPGEKLAVRWRDNINSNQQDSAA